MRDTFHLLESGESGVARRQVAARARARAEGGASRRGASEQERQESGDQGGSDREREHRSIRGGARGAHRVGGKVLEADDDVEALGIERVDGRRHGQRVELGRLEGELRRGLAGRAGLRERRAEGARREEVGLRERNGEQSRKHGDHEQGAVHREGDGREATRGEVVEEEGGTRDQRAEIAQRQRSSQRRRGRRERSNGRRRPAGLHAEALPRTLNSTLPLGRFAPECRSGSTANE